MCAPGKGSALLPDPCIPPLSHRVSCCYRSVCWAPGLPVLSLPSTQSSALFLPCPGAGDCWLSFSPQHCCHPKLSKEWDSYSPFSSFSWSQKRGKRAQLILMLFVGRFISKQNKQHALERWKHPFNLTVIYPVNVVVSDSYFSQQAGF